MRFDCNRQNLTEAVVNVQRAVASKSSIPALEGILIRAEENKLTLCGYNLEICIITSIDAQVHENGESVINAKLLSDIIRRMPEDKITIQVDDKNIANLNCGKANYKIIGIPSSDFPDLPVVNAEDTISISGELIKSMIRQTLYAVSDNDNRPAHKGSLFEIENGFLSIVSVDGYRLAIRKEAIDFNKNKSFIVPGKSLQEVIKLISDDTEEVKLIPGSRHITFETGNYSVISRLIEGEFMNYKAALPSQHLTEVKVNTRKFINTIDRMSLLLTDRIKNPIRCQIDSGLIKTYCNTPLGQAYDEFEVEIEGENVEIGFDNRYMLDALKNSETDEICMHVSGPVKPMVILPSEGDSFLFLVLPMRLKNEN